MIFNCDFFCHMSRVNSCKLFLSLFRVKVLMGTGIGGAALTEREERSRAHFRGPKFGTSSPAVNPRSAQ